MLSLLTRLSLTTLVAVTPVFPASLSQVSEATVNYSFANRSMPKWSHGALIEMESDHSSGAFFRLFDAQGRQLATALFTVQDAVAIQITDWDRAVDGTLAVCGSMIDNARHGVAIVGWISPDGVTSQVVRTGLYAANRIAIAPDGTVWTAGRERLEHPMGKSFADQFNPQADVIRHIDRSGKVVASFVKQSTIRDPLSLQKVTNHLRVSRDRVAWYSNKEQRYVEISSSGSVTDIEGLALPGLPMITGFALTGNGDIFVSAQYSNPHKLSVSMLDRETRAWMPIGQGFPIYGAEEDELVAPGLHWGLTFYRVIR